MKTEVTELITWCTRDGSRRSVGSLTSLSLRVAMTHSVLGSVDSVTSLMYVKGNNELCVFLNLAQLCVTASRTRKNTSQEQQPQTVQFCLIY